VVALNQQQDIFFYGKGNENHEFCTGLSVHKTIMSAVKRVEFVHVRMSYIILRGCWFHIIVLNIHIPTEGKNNYVKGGFYDKLEHTFDKILKYHMKMLLGDCNAKVGKEDIFKQTIGNESLNKISNGNEVRVVNFATSKNLSQKYNVPHHSILKYTWNSPDRKTHNHIDHILIDRRWHANILDVQSMRTADCNTDHYMVVAKVRESRSK
jgi:hypothetical protein